MKSKQVAALMMAATLAVTGSGVTTMAGQISVEDAAEVLEYDSGLKRSWTKDEGSFIDLKDLVVEEGNYTYGSEVSVTATLSKKESVNYSKEFNPILQLVTVTTGATLNTEAEVKAALKEVEKDPSRTYQAAWDKQGNVKHTFQWKPETGKDYYILATVVRAGNTTAVKDYAYKKISVILQTEDKTLDEIRALAPVIPEIILPANAGTDLTAITTNPVIAQAIKDANDKLTNGEGTWDYNTSEKGTLSNATSEITLKFTSERYKEASNKGIYTVNKIPVKVTQKTATVTLKKGDSFTAQAGETETLTIGGDARVTLELKAEFDTKSSANAATPNAVTWKPVGDAANYLSIVDQKNGQATIVANKATGKDGVTVRAEAADNPEVAYKEVKIVINQGIGAADVKAAFQKYQPLFKDFTYVNAEKFADHFEAELDQMNDSEKEPLAQYGTFSLVADPDFAGDIAVVGGEHKLKLVYTTNTVDTSLLVDVSTGGWEDASSNNKKLTSDPITVTVSPKVISKDNVLGELDIKTEGIVIGAVLDDIYKQTGASEKTYTVVWQGLQGGQWTNVETTGEEKVESLGKLTNYRLKIDLKDDTAKKNYQISGGDDQGFIYVTPDVTIGAPTFEATATLDNATSKYLTGSTVTLTAAPANKDALEPALGSAKAYYDTDQISYQWYRVKDGAISKVNDTGVGETDTITGSKTNRLIITKATKASEAEYYCTVAVDLGTEGKKVEALAKSEFSTLKKETNKLKVELSGIEFKSGTSATDITYGTKDASTGSIEVKAKGEKITSYSISYYEADAKTQADKGTRTEVTPDNYLFSGGTDASVLFTAEGGYPIKHDVSAMLLPAGAYNFYVTVKADDDENTYGPLYLTVKQKELTVDSLDGKNLSVVKPLTYGDKLADAEFTYKGKEGENLKFVPQVTEDQNVLKAGTHDVKVKAEPIDGNYTLSAEKILDATVTVDKATLTVTAANAEITEGDKEAKLSVKVDGVAEGDKEEEIVTAKAVVFDQEGKEISDFSALKAGAAYKIEVEAELTDAGKENYKVEKVTGILNVKAKAEEQKPGTQDPGTNKPGTQDPGTNKPGTQGPGTSTPGTNTPGTNTPGTQDPGTNTPGTEETVTAKKVDITLNGQSLSGTVKAKVKATYKLKASVTLSNGKKASSVKWKSSNTKIAKVSSKGVVKVQNKTGKVKITATYSDGNASKAKTITLNVAKANVKAASLKISGKKTMKAKKSQTLQVTVSPATVTNGKVTWKTSNKKIATVSSKGVVKALKKGKVTITATAKDGSRKKASFKITVK